MVRRDFVRTLLLAIFAPRLLKAQQKNEGALPAAAPVPWTMGLNPKTPLPETTSEDAIAGAVPEFFSAQQMAALTRLSDLMMPAIDGRPGALDAQTPQFLDFLIASSPAPRKKLYADGLDWLNAQSMQKHKTDFSKLDAAQAASIVDPWLRSWFGDHPPSSGHQAFMNIARSDIREATVNSTEWAKTPVTGGEQKTMTALYWQPIEPIVHEGRMVGCDVIAPGALGTHKGGDVMPEYQRQSQNN